MSIDFTSQCKQMMLNFVTYYTHYTIFGTIVYRANTCNMKCKVRVKNTMKEYMSATGHTHLLHHVVEVDSEMNTLADSKGVWQQ